MRDNTNYKVYDLPEEHDLRNRPREGDPSMIYENTDINTDFNSIKNEVKDLF